MDKSLAAAFIHNDRPRRKNQTRHRVCGVRLRRFSVWHRFLLMTIDSPFMGKKRVTLFDIRTAAGICRLGFDDSKIRRPWLWLTIVAIFLAWRTSWWRKYLERQTDKFLDYAGDYLSRPEYGIIQPSIGFDRPSPFPTVNLRTPVPEEFALVADVIAFFGGCSEKEAWDMPIGRAYWYQLAHRREKGADVDFMTEEEREFQRELSAELEAASRVEGANNGDDAKNNHGNERAES